MPEVPSGKDRQENYRKLQAVLDLPDPQANLDAIADGYEALRAAVKVFGGGKLLALSLGHELSYEAHLSNGLNRSGDRHAFFDWLFPMLRHPEAGKLLIEHLCVAAGFEIPDRRPDTFTETDEVKAWRRVMARMGIAGEAAMSEVAKELGTDVAALRGGR